MKKVEAHHITKMKFFLIKRRHNLMTFSDYLRMIDLYINCGFNEVDLHRNPDFKTFKMIFNLYQHYADNELELTL